MIVVSRGIGHIHAFGLALIFISSVGCGKIDGSAVSVVSSVRAPSDLSYKWDTLTYTVNTQIATNFATTTGGTPSAYSISPALPSGLSLSATTGAITGTPTSADVQDTYTVTASNSGGSTSASLTITINADDSGRIFSAGCTMTTKRGYHISILLNTGKVLLAGGYDHAGTLLQSAELFDPSTGTCTATGSMNVGRGDSGVMAFLSNGKVLVAGGTGALSSAEIYDPSTEQFTVTGTMAVGRQYAKAVTLENGKVLVVGGKNATNDPLVSAELYDPATGTFSLTGSMSSSRGSYHSITLLQSGKVLVTGGSFAGAQGDIRGNAEIYDPSTATFSAVSNNMSNARNGHGAALLPNGKVLLAGGRSLAWGATTVTTADLYDPATNSFAATGNITGAARSMSNNYGGDAVLLPNGKVLLVGSHQDGCTASLNTSDLYNPTTGTFSAGPTMGTARQVNGATLLPDGNVFVSGGTTTQCGYGGMVNTTELFQ